MTDVLPRGHIDRPGDGFSRFPKSGGRGCGLTIVIAPPPRRGRVIHGPGTAGGPANGSHSVQDDTQVWISQ